MERLLQIITKKAGSAFPFWIQVGQSSIKPQMPNRIQNLGQTGRYSIAFHWTLAQFHGSMELYPVTVEEIRVHGSGCFTGVI